MNIKRLQFIIFLLGGALAVGGCAKPATEEEPTPIVEEPEPIPATIVQEPVVEEEVPIIEAAPVEEDTIPDEPVIIPQEESPDSAAYWYMIRPHDWLIKIAEKEYGNLNEWRSIYAWNRDDIDDNPNLIYPYHNLVLYKLEAEINPFGSDTTIHTVVAGETLWSIAGKEYGDELAWIVCFWDNEKLFAENGGLLKPGMELKIRTRLWPED